jgi:predicted AAA+ superfamily ATPase
MEIRRLYYDQLFARLSEPRRFIQVIAGPRQVGKTTTVRQLLENINIPCQNVVADNVASSNNVWIDQQWEASRQLLRASGSSEFLLVIDEIQKQV